MRRLLFIAATHGDEGFAVDVLKRVEERYRPERYGYDWTIGNPRALAQSKRYTDTDLNRSAPGDAASPCYEERRAAAIVQKSAAYDAVIDLHGSVAQCGIVKIIPYPTIANLALARAVPLKRNVVWYSAASAQKGPLAQHMQCPAIEIECGPKDDPQIAIQLEAVIGSILTANAAACAWPIMDGQELYSVYGPQRGAFDQSVSDFNQTTRDGETFFPFMSNQYEGTLCYKMHQVAPAHATALIA